MELKRVLFVYNSEKPGAEGTARRGGAWCWARGIEAELTPRRRFSMAEVDLVVAVGGDGTLLRAAAALYPREVPILGVHMGSLGFLSCCNAADLERALAAVAAGEAILERRLRLELIGTPHTALNDVAVLGTAKVRFTELSVRTGEERVYSFAGDGVVVATPTGASAYALSCGGPLVHPAVEALLVAPIAPHRLGIRPVLLPTTSEVHVQARYPAEVWVDGDPVSELPAGEGIALRAAAAATLLVRIPGGEGYFSRLKRLGCCQ